MTDRPPIVYIVDDDDAVRSALALQLETEGFQTQGFASAREFLESCPVNCRCQGCVILDLQMPDMDGLSLQRQINERGITLPIIFISGHGTVPDAVRALQDGAMNFIEKPIDREILLACVRKALVQDSDERSRAARKTSIEQRLNQLTAREREIMSMIVGGTANKVIASDLGISERTVELHRSRILHKMGVRNAVRLTQLVVSLQD